LSVKYCNMNTAAIKSQPMAVGKYLAETTPIF